MTTHTIGTASRDYSTIQAWIDAAPATLVAEWRGQCYNDSEFLVTAAFIVLGSFTGHTTDATNRFILECATGQSFRDNASVQTNALRYNVSNGVAGRATGNYSHTIVVADSHVTVSGLQLSATDTANYGQAIAANGAVNDIQASNCILEGSGPAFAVYMYDGAALGISTIKNCLIIAHNAAAGGLRLGNTSNAYFCTIISPSNVASTNNGILKQYAAGTIENCAVFGFTGFADAGAWGGSNNASDNTIAFGSANQASKTYANQFQQSSDAGSNHDFRLKSGSDCIDTGLTDSTNGAFDIANTARPSGSAYDIGAWEFVSVSYQYQLMGQIIF